MAGRCCMEVPLELCAGCVRPVFPSQPLMLHCLSNLGPNSSCWAPCWATNLAATLASISLRLPPQNPRRFSAMGNSQASFTTDSDTEGSSEGLSTISSRPSWCSSGDWAAEPEKLDDGDWSTHSWLREEQVGWDEPATALKTFSLADCRQELQQVRHCGLVWEGERRWFQKYTLLGRGQSRHRG